MMRSVPDPYRVLGLRRDATTREVKAAHRRLAKRYHPDRPQGDTTRFLAIQAAYLLLVDPVRRRAWDAAHAPGPVAAGVATSAGRRSRRRASARAADARRRAPHEPAATGEPPTGMDAYARSSGAAWSAASRAYFRRAAADLPRGPRMGHSSQTGRVGWEPPLDEILKGSHGPRPGGTEPPSGSSRPSGAAGEELPDQAGSPGPPAEPGGIGAVIERVLGRLVHIRPER